jgi:hypothetical protein
VQTRVGADKLAVVLIDVDPEYFAKTDEYLPKAKKILEKHKVDWPNVLAANGFNDTMHAFNLSGYGNIVVDAKGMVRGVNVHGMELQHLVDQIMEAKPTTKPK